MIVHNYDKEYTCEIDLSELKCWNFTTISRAIYSSINNIPIRILLSLLQQVGHAAFNFGFYVQVHLVSIFLVFQKVLFSLCSNWLPKQIIKTARDLRQKSWNN